MKKKIQLGGVDATIRNDDFRRNTALQLCRPKNCRCKSPIGSKATMEFVWLNSQALLKSGLSNGEKKRYSVWNVSQKFKKNYQSKPWLFLAAPLLWHSSERKRDDLYSKNYKLKFQFTLFLSGFGWILSFVSHIVYTQEQPPRCYSQAIVWKNCALRGKSTRFGMVK